MKEILEKKIDMKNKYFLLVTFVIISILPLDIVAQYGNITINSFSPVQGNFGTSVKIKGNHFLVNDFFRGSVPNYLTVKFGNYVAQITSATSTQIVVTVPNNIPNGNYNIIVMHPQGFAETSWTFKVITQTENVSYFHGFNDGNSAWSYAEALFMEEFNANHSVNKSYDGKIAINSAASSYYNTLVPYDNTVVIGHSMGGVVAREMIRQKGKNNSRIKALITVGSPHKGAPIAKNARAYNNISKLMRNWTSDLLNPWLAIIPYANAFNIAFQFLFPIADFVYDYFDPANIQSPAAIDLIPNSSFMQTLNSNPVATLPDAVYTIYGHEDWYSHWRLADCFNNNKQPETGNYVNYLIDLMRFYLEYYFICYNISNNFYNLYKKYLRNWKHERAWEFFQLSVRWRAISNSFISSVYALNTLHQIEWNRFMVGEYIDFENKDCVNDAFIPKYSQTPNFVEEKRHFEAKHTNHLEETTKKESIDEIRKALLQPDVNLKK